MAELANGHVTVRLGVNGTPAGLAAPSTFGRLPRIEQRARIERLRDQGWSYRRIAAASGLSYREVSRLLDGDDGRIGIPYASAVPLPRLHDSAVPASSPAAATASAPPPGDAVLDEILSQNRFLQQRVEHLLLMCDAQRQALGELERSMISTLRNEHRALGQRLLDGVKALLQRFLPSPLRSSPPRGPDVSR